MQKVIHVCYSGSYEQGLVIDIYGVVGEVAFYSFCKAQMFYILHFYFARSLVICCLVQLIYVSTK